MMNQCDGCRVGAPKVGRYGHHQYSDGSLIACTKARYDSPVAMGHPMPEEVTLKDYIERKQGEQDKPVSQESRDSSVSDTSSNSGDISLPPG